MKKILYITIADSVHDQRFMHMLVEGGFEGYALRVSSGDWPTPAGVNPLEPMGFKFPLMQDQIPRFTQKLSGILRSLQPDLVQAGPLHDLAYLAVLAGAKPLLAQSWGFDLMHDSFANPENLKRTNFVLSHSQGLIVDAHSSAKKAVELGFMLEHIYDFPWGVDLALFNKEKWHESGLEYRKQLGWEKNKVLFCLRSWEEKYGVLQLCQSFTEAAGVLPNLRLLLAGGGSQEEEIKAILRKGKVENKAILPGRIPNRELPQVFAAADIYVSPSHVDGSSVSLMEALASSLPALVSDIPANLEWVQEGINGWVYPDGEMDDLTECILAASQAQLAPMQAAARRTAEQKADWQINKKVLMRAWKDLLQKEEV
ncbi:MAG: glycosyltransferase family 4 protein [Anaerolineaceae bacterium]|nr:glycosyltransferase family 4 protein [Anaerolineaceae bacterium]